MWHVMKWVLTGVFAVVWLGTVAAYGNVQPPAEPTPAADECACDPPVPGEVQRLRTEVRLLKAAARVNAGIHAKTVKQLELLKACLDMADSAKPCRALER